MPFGSPAATPPRLPPVYRAIEAGDRDVLARATETGRQAGDFIHHADADTLAYAVVLEPEMPLAVARLVLPLGLDALAGALTAALPPGSTVAIRWPDAVTVGGMMIGGARLAAPAGSSLGATPDWLVLAAVLRRDASGAEDPGNWTRGTTLAEEGLPDLDPAAFTELFAAHFLSRIDLWLTESFAPVAAAVASRLDRSVPGAFLGPSGDLLAPGDVVIVRFPDLDAPPTWLDPETGLPWL